jgi:hypothetical protein
MPSINAGVRRALDQPRVIRYLGLAGVLCLAVDAYLYGAFRQLRAHVTIQAVATRPDGPLILALWVLGTGALGLAWWFGRHLVARAAVTASWAMVTAVLWAVPMAVVPPTGSRDVYAYACQGALYAAGDNPYRVGVSSLPCPWLDSVSYLWRDTPAPYGPVFLMLAGVASRLGSLTAAIVAFRGLALVSVALIAVALPALARRVGVPVGRAIWLVLACPLVSVHLIGGAHNDALVLAMLVVALLVASLAVAPRHVWALLGGGVLFGVAMAVKTTVGVALPFAALFAGGLFAGGSRWPVARAAVGRAGAFAAVALGTLLILSFGSGLGVGWAGALSHAGDSIAWTSPPTGVGLTVDYIGRAIGVHTDAVPVARLVALVALPIVLLAILWRVRDRDPLYGAGLAMLATIFLAPITQPWYLMWPLAVFAVTTVVARWFLGTVVVAMFTVLPDGTGWAKAVQLPASLAMTVLVAMVAIRGLRWLRGAEPRSIDVSADEPALVSDRPAV